ncbi:MAG: hypothetical protein HOW97_33730 [Catenulispora sp.]|nr:hypothetical protein [Catenulispora sp.]
MAQNAQAQGVAGGGAGGDAGGGAGGTGRAARGAAVPALLALLVAAAATGCSGSDSKKDPAKPTAEVALNGWNYSKLDGALLGAADLPGFRARVPPPARTPTTAASVSDQCRDFADASRQIISSLGADPVASTALNGTGTEKDYLAAVWIRAYASPTDAAHAVSAFHDGVAKCAHGVTALDPALGDSSAGYVAGTMDSGRFGDIAVQVGTLTIGVQMVHQGTAKPDADALTAQLKAIAQKQVAKVKSAGA